MDLLYEIHGLSALKAMFPDLSYYVVKILILFAEMQGKQANIFHFQIKNMR
jgi:hypothetical protein